MNKWVADQCTEIALQFYEKRMQKESTACLLKLWHTVTSASVILPPSVHGICYFMFFLHVQILCVLHPVGQKEH
jgi:hypothetical protein